MKIAWRGSAAPDHGSRDKPISGDHSTHGRNHFHQATFDEVREGVLAARVAWRGSTPSRTLHPQGWRSCRAEWTSWVCTLRRVPVLGKLTLVNADVREWEWDGEPFHWSESEERREREGGQS